MAMYHMEVDQPAPRLKEQLVTALRPMLSFGTATEAWNALGYHRYGIAQYHPINFNEREPEALYSRLVDSWSRPILTIQTSAWVDNRARIVEWLNEEWVRLELTGEPLAAWKFANAWSKRRRTLSRSRPNPTGAAIANLPLGSLYSDWDGSRLTRHIGALSLKTFN